MPLPLRIQQAGTPRLRFTLLLSVLCAALALSACLKVYKLDVPQGNIVTQEMVNKLRPGMTRAQVRFVLGTPLVVDTFHRDRWEYFYSYKKTVDGVAETRRLTLLFKDDQLQSVEGDVATKLPDTPVPVAADKPAS